MGYRVAVVGATGNVGREMLNILDERRFPADEVVALASERSIGTEVSFGDKILKCKRLDTYDFRDTDICLMSAGGGPSKEWSPKIGAQGCVVLGDPAYYARFGFAPCADLVFPGAPATHFLALTLDDAAPRPAGIVRYHDAFHPEPAQH